ncbi:MAG: D-alanyl-D-alanine carboxypeptidase/D-alanyl-D-alanine-endopeptidase [Nitrospinae bacterium]|nr:D-alanyl-D-alanine carboxypeptidase/D-alanyl-D-alanine-endopeptidase [Nitrospinota bacterium]
MNQKKIKAASFAVALTLLPAHAFADSFKSRIERIMNNPCLNRAKVCLQVKSLNNGQVYYQKNPDELLVPASNMKIITAATALKTLKPWYKFDTIFSHTGERKGEVLDGDLVITGQGDPHIGTEDLWGMSNEIRRRGIRQIKGNIVLDDGYFDGEAFPPGWRISSIRKAYEAPGGALSLNFNTVTVIVTPPASSGARPTVSVDPQSPYFTIVNNMNTVSRGRTFVAIRMKRRPDGGEILEVIGKVRPGARESAYFRSVADPVLYFGHTFIEMLKNAGVTVNGQIVHSQASKPSKKIFVHSSRPLILQVMDMNKFSNNFMAEQILKTIGAEEVSSPGTIGKGVYVVERLLHSWGLINRFHIVDGSGLSKENRLTCSLLTDVLEKMYKEWEGGPEFITSLAVMGKEGSVRKRRLSATEPIRVKTGTLDAVSALSGYYPLENGEVLGFSMIFNNLGCYHGMAQHIQNRLILEFETVHNDER